MPNTFINRQLTLGTTLTSVNVYTVPAATTSILVHYQAANVDPNLNTISFSTCVCDTTQNPAVSTFLIRNVPIPSGAALVVAGGGKQVLQTGNCIRASTSTWASSAIDLNLSIMEMT